MTKDFRPDIGDQKYSFDDVQGVSLYYWIGNVLNYYDILVIVIQSNSKI